MSIMSGEKYQKDRHETSMYVSWASDIMSLVDQIENKRHRQSTALGDDCNFPATLKRLRTHKFKNRLTVNENGDELTTFSFDDAITYLTTTHDPESKPILAVNKPIRPMTWDHPMTYGEKVHIIDRLQLFKLEPVCASLNWKSVYGTMSLTEFSFCDYIPFVFCAQEELKLIEAKHGNLLEHIEKSRLQFNTLVPPIDWIPEICQVYGLSVMRMIFEYVLLINRYQVPSGGYEKHLPGKYPGRYRDLLTKALTNLTSLYIRFTKQIVNTEVLDYENILMDLQHLDAERRSCEIVLMCLAFGMFGVVYRSACGGSDQSNMFSPREHEEMRATSIACVMHDKYIPRVEWFAVNEIDQRGEMRPEDRDKVRKELTCDQLRNAYTHNKFAVSAAARGKVGRVIDTEFSTATLADIVQLTSHYKDIMSSCIKLVKSLYTTD